jgi:hypothetical protein
VCSSDLDSEDGPRDEANPMKTRTYINNQ